jgi:HAD superfamily hydrolase (TIGR01490 family)
MKEFDRKIAFFDIDKTAYDGFLLFPMIDAQAKIGLITVNSQDAINGILSDFELGKIAYSEMVRRTLDQYAKSLSGRSAEDVLDATRKYLTGEGNRFYPYVQQVIGQIRDTHDVFFVTAEPQFVADATNDIYHADGAISTIFTVRDGIFTGDIDNALSSGQHKADAIAHLLASHNTQDSLAFGDSEGDIGMLDAVDYAICINPSPGLQEVAEQKKWFVSFSPQEVSGYVENILA